MSIFSLLPIPNVRHIHLYTKPVSMRLGELKLIELCRKDMEIDPHNGDVFLFFNKAKDKLKLFYLDENGSQEMMKVLPKGGFILPVANNDQKFLKIEASKLSSLFRT